MTKERLTKLASVRFSESDWAEVVKVAEREGMDAAAYIRGATLTVMALRGNRHALKAVKRGFVSLISEITQRRTIAGGESVAAP